MITIPSMPTQYRPLPELEIHLEIPQLRELARILDRVKVDNKWLDGLCNAVAEMATQPDTWHAFGNAVSYGMNRDVGEPGRFCVYLYQYLDEDDVSLEELTAIRQAWAAHIARSIYEQIGA